MRMGGRDGRSISTGHTLAAPCASPEAHRVSEWGHRCLSRLKFLRFPGRPPCLIFGSYPLSTLGLIRLFLGSLVALFRPRAAIVAENLALRHQLGVLLGSRPARLPFTSWDRALWAFALQRFPGWRQRLVIVNPETVIAWHRQAFRLF